MQGPDTVVDLKRVWASGFSLAPDLAVTGLWAVNKQLVNLPISVSPCQVK